MNALAAADQVDRVFRSHAGVNGARTELLEHMRRAVAVALEQRPTVRVVKVRYEVLDDVPIAAQSLEHGSRVVPARLVELGVRFEQDAQSARALRGQREDCPEDLRLVPLDIHADEIDWRALGQ